MIAIAMVAIVAALMTVIVLWHHGAVVGLIAASIAGSAAAILTAIYIAATTEEPGGSTMVNALNDVEHEPEPQEVYSALLKLATVSLNTAQSAQRSIDRLLLAVKILAVANVAIVLLVLTLGRS